MSFLEKLQTIDKRIIYLLLALSIAVPLLKPLNLPFSVGAEVRDSYNWIEQNVAENDLVLFSFDISTGAMPELGPITSVVLAHLAQKGARVIGMCTAPDGVILGRQLWEPLESELPYGEKFVHLGFLAGGESGLAAFLENPYGVFNVDINGTDVKSMPVMQGFNNVDDLTMMISINCGPTEGCSVVQWMRQGYATFKKSVWIGLNAVMAPGAMPYYKSGQLTGYIAGIRGAAEYEKLIERPALATAAMDAQSASHGLIILFIILGNVGMFYSKKKTAGGRSA